MTSQNQELILVPAQGERRLLTRWNGWSSVPPYACGRIFSGSAVSLGIEGEAA
jgi:hypothetical protein